MARLKTIIFGSSGDIGKNQTSIKKNNIFEFNSKELDLSNITKAKNFNVKIIPDNIIFVSAKIILKTS